MISKRIKGQTYYYLAESARVGGKPRIVSQRYLGRAQDIAAAVDGAMAAPERTRHLGFGDVAAAWSVLDRLDVAAVIDAVVGSRRGDAAASVGTYLALATLNRIVAPCSKLAFADWWTTTAADRWVKIGSSALDHRRFWDAMNAVTTEQLVEAEARLGLRMVEVFGLDTRGLVLDMTNFATFIDTGNARAPIAQRGHAKQKRHDLRLVGLGLVVTRDGGVPVVGYPYPGNRPDVSVFGAVIAELAARYQRLTGGTGDTPTVVFDAGNDSADNLALIEALELGYVGSLVVSQHPDLLAVPRRRYRVADPDRFGPLTYVETTTQALGAARRVILTHSPQFHAKQARGFEQTLATAGRQLAALAAKLSRGRTRRARAAVQADIDTILAPRWCQRVITTELTGHRPADLRLAWRIDTRARRAVEDEVFGKRILFTDRDWPAVEVIAAYRAQDDAEKGFRQLKDHHQVSFSPMFHWTDQKIRVHVFYCVLALAIAHLMRRLADQAGLHLSVRALLAELAGIGETILLYPSTGGRPKARRMLTDMTDTQRHLYETFNLHRYAPR